MKEQPRREIMLHTKRGAKIMSTSADKLVSQIKDLPDTEKLRLVDAILTELDKPDPEIDRIWAEEARKRWLAYKGGGLSTVSYEEVMSKYRR
jgi:putative addiction module component (TIGR02574 family)